MTSTVALERPGRAATARVGRTGVEGAAALAAEATAGECVLRARFGCRVLTGSDADVRRPDTLACAGAAAAVTAVCTANGATLRRIVRAATGEDSNSNRSIGMLHEERSGASACSANEGARGRTRPPARPASLNEARAEHVAASD